jgi:tetratricopeptide (TPR) repeat protein
LRALAAGTLGFIAVLPAVLSDLDEKLSLSNEAGAWVRAALEDLPPRGRALLGSDDLAAGTTYEQVVAGGRPDAELRLRVQLSEAALRAAWQPGTRWEPSDDPAPAVEPGMPLWRLAQIPPRPLPDPRPLAARMDQLLSPGRDPFVRKLSAFQLGRLAELYYKNGELDRAQALFEAALGVRPEDASAATNLAVVLARRGDYERALALVEKVLARDPTRSVAR